MLRNLIGIQIFLTELIKFYHILMKRDEEIWTHALGTREPVIL